MLTFLWFRLRSPNEEALAMMMPEEREKAMREASSRLAARLRCWSRCRRRRSLYVFWNYDYLINRILYVDDLHPLDMAMGVVAGACCCSRRRGA